MIDYSVIEKVMNLVKEKHLHISAAESCTGGLVSASVVHETGASDVFCEGYVSYSIDAKHRILGVSEETLRTRGAVSEETAREMANGLHHVTGAEICITTTGIAGPGGETEEKPVGLVYIGIYVLGKIVVI